MSMILLLGTHLYSLPWYQKKQPPNSIVKKSTMSARLFIIRWIYDSRIRENLAKEHSLRQARRGQGQHHTVAWRCNKCQS